MSTVAPSRKGVPFFTLRGLGSDIQDGTVYEIVIPLATGDSATLLLDRGEIEDLQRSLESLLDVVDSAERRA